MKYKKNKTLTKKQLKEILESLKSLKNEIEIIQSHNNDLVYNSLNINHENFSIRNNSHEEIKASISYIAQNINELNEIYFWANYKIEKYLK